MIDMVLEDVTELYEHLFLLYHGMVAAVELLMTRGYVVTTAGRMRSCPRYC